MAFMSQKEKSAVCDNDYQLSAATAREWSYLHSKATMMSTEMRKSHSVTALTLALTPTATRKSKIIPRNRKYNGSTCLLITAVITLSLLYGSITLLILNRGYASRRDEIDSINIFQKDHGSSLANHPHLQHNDISRIFLEGLPQSSENGKVHLHRNKIYQKPASDWSELSELLKNDPMERVAYLRKRMPVD